MATLVLVEMLVVTVVLRLGGTADPDRSFVGELLEGTAKGLPGVWEMELLDSVAVPTDEGSGREHGGATVTTPPPTATLAPGSCPMPGTQVREAVTVLR